MNFVVFPVGATNIFPLANSSAGGQLMSEFNIRSRESVQTDPTVKYFIGPSYAHSMDDFAVYCQKDGQDVTISNTAVQIQPGRALVNGHYVESLTPIVIDLNDANTYAGREGIAALKGKLAIGLRMAYSTYQTLAGSALVEDEHGEFFNGIQAVILPADKVILPKDAPGETEFSKVNMHLLLATFTYRNGVISNMIQNPEKICSITADRISNMGGTFSDVFVTKTGLDPNKLYVFAGKSADGESIDGRDTWCDATDSLMQWDTHPNISTTAPSTQAAFVYDDTTGQTVLNIPHKQVDGMVNTQGQHVYFQDKQLVLPAADFAGHGGVISPEYSRRVLEIENKINTYYRLPNGRMRQYIPVLNDRADLPVIPTSKDERWPYAASEYKLDISGLKSDIAQIRAELEELRNSIPSIVSDSIPEALRQSGEIDSITSRLTTIETQLNSIWNQLSQSESSGGTAPTREEFNQLVSSVNALSTTVTQLSTDIQNIQTSTVPEAVRNQFLTLMSQIDDAVANYATRIVGLETDLQTYITNRVNEALDKKNVFTTWTWSPGDYVLVGQDNTVGATINGRSPSTMYVIGPGKVLTITGVTALSIPIDVQDPEYDKLYAQMLRQVPEQLAGGVELDSRMVTDESELPNAWDLVNGMYKGAPGIDYFVARRRTYNESTHIETWTCWYYTPALTEDRFSYLDPIWITGGVPLATETSVGGFVNVPEGAYGGGYVRMDENGYLKVMDYELLLTGVLAYQLGQDRSEGAGLTVAELQSILDEEVNDRVCFPNSAQIASAIESEVDPHIIHLYLTLPEESGTITIHDIGSRYESSLYVHIRGNATNATTLVFENCDKLRIDEDIEGAPQIILQNVNLYYNATVLDACETISNLSLWYQRWSDMDPELQVDGMTVSLTGPIETTEDIDPWDSTYANDNHYSYALRSITFGNDGSIINVGMLVGDSTTANIDEGKSVFVSQFMLPQSVGLTYPATKMTHQIKVTGTFVSHYYVASDSAYMMKSTEFSALTQKYDPISATNITTGTIAFYTDAELVDHISGVSPTTTVDCWDLNTPHYFIGGAID